MRINEQTVRYPTEEIDEVRRRGEDRTAARLDAKSEAELEAAIDPETKKATLTEAARGSP